MREWSTNGVEPKLISLGVLFVPWPLELSKVVFPLEPRELNNEGILFSIISLFKLISPSGNVSSSDYFEVLFFNPAEPIV
jgi:hypothetical protein